MKALITGISGFVGGYMAEYLVNHGIEVIGTVRQTSCPDRLQGMKDNVRLAVCELHDASAVERLIQAEKPDWIVHLAAESFVPASWRSPAETITGNAAGQVHLMEAVLRHRPDCRMVIACSSEEYGMVFPGELPVTERNPLRPMNPYAVSKVVQDYLAYQYFRRYGLDLIRLRTFNHIGPWQKDSFVTASFAKQIAEIEAGRKPPVLMVGNLSAKRDFTDVRDVVRAYGFALEKGATGEVYNVASGRCWSMEDVLKQLLALSRDTISVQQDPARLRPSDVEVLVGDFSKFHSATRWKPEIPLHQTLQDLLAYWRDAVSRGAG